MRIRLTHSNSHLLAVFFIDLCLGNVYNKFRSKIYTKYKKERRDIHSAYRELQHE